MDLESALAALPVVATSPFALVAYIVAILAWVVVTLRVRRNKQLLTHLKDLPQRDRLKALEFEMGVVPLKSGLSPEQYLRSRIHLYYLIGFLAICLVIVLIIAMTITHTPETGTPGSVGIAITVPPDLVSPAPATPSPNNALVSPTATDKSALVSPTSTDNSALASPMPGANSSSILPTPIVTVNNLFVPPTPGVVDPFALPTPAPSVANSAIPLTPTASNTLVPPDETPQVDSPEETPQLEVHGTWEANSTQTASVIPVEQVNEEEDPGDLGANDNTLRYSFDFVDNGVRVFPNLPYLDLLSKGGPVLPSSPYLPSKWEFPELAVQTVNNTDQTIFLTSALVRVGTSEVNKEPLLEVIGGERRLTVGFKNEGWGAVFSPTLRYAITPSKQCSDRTFSEPIHSLIIPSFSDYGEVKIPVSEIPTPTATSGYLSNVCMEGILQYANEQQEPRSLIFKTYVSLFDIAHSCCPPVPLHTYNLLLNAGKSNYTQVIPIEQVMKPGEVDSFRIKIATEKSAGFRLSFSFRTADNKELPGGNVLLEVLVPRTSVDYHDPQGHIMAPERPRVERGPGIP